MPPDLSHVDFDKETFIHKVKECIQIIEQGDCEKIVLSRQRTISFPKKFNLFYFYQNLLHLYPDSFVSLVHSFYTGTWIVASPEQLLGVKADGTLETVSLAGTQLFDKTKPIEEARWSHKEIEEQSLVTKYIIDCFKSIRLREFDFEGPRTTRSGDILHLKTTFTINPQAMQVQIPHLPDVLLHILHPTSAVCGIPQQKAEAFIHEIEPHFRDYYTGFLGPVHVDGESHLFVTIRAARLFRSHLVFYSGMGITRDSKPFEEWKETEWKIHSLFKAAFL